MCLYYTTISYTLLSNVILKHNNVIYYMLGVLGRVLERLLILISSGCCVLGTGKTNPRTSGHFTKTVRVRGTACQRRQTPFSQRLFQSELLSSICESCVVCTVKVVILLSVYKKTNRLSHLVEINKQAKLQQV